MNDSMMAAITTITYCLAISLLAFIPIWAVADIRQTTQVLRRAKSKRSSGPGRRPRKESGMSAPADSIAMIITSIMWSVSRLVMIVVPILPSRLNHRFVSFAGGLMTIFWVSYISLLLIAGSEMYSAWLFFVNWLTVTIVAGLAVFTDRSSDRQRKIQQLLFLPVFYFFWPLITLVGLTAKQAR